MLDKKEYVGTILMDISEAFDTIYYRCDYGFSKETPKLIFS